MGFLPRLHLFEWEDFPWYPAPFREGQTDFLRWMMRTFKPLEGTFPKIAAAYQASKEPYLLDLCAGGGGSLEQLKAYFGEKPFRAILTDKYPNLEAFRLLAGKYPMSFGFREEPLDVLEPFDCPQGFVTLFNAFHHLTPNQGTALLTHLVGQGRPLAILEPNDRSVWQLFANTLSLPVLQLLATPFIKPFRWSRLLFTYLIPAIPLCTLWDGWVSVFRTYTPAELQKMTRIADPEGTYHWEIGKARHPFGQVGFMIGMKIERSQTV